VFEYFGTPAAAAPLPSLLSLFWQFFVCAFINDIGFYWSHRLFHTPFFYQRYHKKHHQYTGTIGFAAEYAHPMEQV
jgi:sterol desaturase/sphingolipid hydroxylase (fatty acid hydroxylase superfamily)